MKDLFRPHIYTGYYWETIDEDIYRVWYGGYNVPLRYELFRSRGK